MDNKIFGYFKIANAGRYFCKEYFFDLKRKLLVENGHFDGWDLRVVNTKSGIEKYFLKRYLLNDELFHLLYFNYYPQFGFDFRKTYRTRIHYETIEPKESYKALFILLLLYDPMKFTELVNTQFIANNHWVKVCDEVLRELDRLRRYTELSGEYLPYEQDKRKATLDSFISRNLFGS